MEKVSKAVVDIMEKNLSSMRENISQSLAEKAANKLEDMKSELASSYFEQR